MHPGAKLLCSASAIAAVFSLPSPIDLFFGIGGFVLALAIDDIGSRDRSFVFVRLLLFGAVWLLVIHCVRLPPLRIDVAGLHKAGTFLARVALAFALTIWWSKSSTKEETYAFLIARRIPMPLMLVLLRAIYAIPQLETRSREVLTNYRLRGFPMDRLRDRIKAAVITLPTIFTSFAISLSESTATLITKGVFLEGRKTTLTRLEWRWSDTFACLTSTLVAGTLLTLKGCRLWP
jgi:hypothetical protein